MLPSPILGTGRSTAGVITLSAFAPKASPIPCYPLAGLCHQHIKRQVAALSAEVYTPGTVSQEQGHHTASAAAAVCQAGEALALVATVGCTLKLLLLLLHPDSSEHAGQSAPPRPRWWIGAWHTTTKRFRRGCSKSHSSTAETGTTAHLVESAPSKTAAQIGQSILRPAVLAPPPDRLGTHDLSWWLTVNVLAINLVVLFGWAARRCSRWAGGTSQAAELAALLRSLGSSGSNTAAGAGLAALAVRQAEQSQILGALQKQVSKVQLMAKLHMHDVGTPLKQVQSQLATQAETSAQLAIQQDKLEKEVVDMQHILIASQATASKQFTVLVRAIQMVQKDQSDLDARVLRPPLNATAPRKQGMGSGPGASSNGASHVYAVPPDPWQQDQHGSSPMKPGSAPTKLVQNQQQPEVLPVEVIVAQDSSHGMPRAGAEAVQGGASMVTQAGDGVEQEGSGISTDSVKDLHADDLAAAPDGNVNEMREAKQQPWQYRGDPC